MTHLDNLVFELTAACNQRCRFCYNYWRDGASPLPPPDGRLARRTLRKLLSQASVGTLSFSGGEPTLLRNIHDLALHARFKGCQVHVLTNGTLLTPGALADFCSIGVGAIQIPILSASPEVHDALTGLPGSWAKASAALRAVVAAMPEGAVAVLVITRVNAAGLDRTLEFIGDIGVKTVMVNRFNLGGLGLRNARDLVLDRAGLRAAFAAVERFAAARPVIRFASGVCTPVCLLEPRDYPHIRFTACSTDFNRRPVALSYNGDVRFCNHSPHVLGNIFDRPVGEILSDPAAAARYGAVPDMCRDCRDLLRCNGGCRAASEQVYGDFGRVDPVLEGLR